LDHWLAGEFQRLGGELRAGERWGRPLGIGTVRATGRHPEAVVRGWRWFGLKVHARRLTLDADLELHFVPSGYVGLARLADGVVNICGVFRSQVTVPNLAQRWRQWLSGPGISVLATRLAKAQFDEASFCAVAGFDLRPQRAGSLSRECSVGDAVTMIPPLTGNGMSMAFESAELAVGPLAKFAHGELTWAEAQHELAVACDQTFARRLRWAACLQPALFSPPARALLLFMGAHSEYIWRRFFSLTR